MSSTLTEHRVLVTGATGFAGGALARALVQRGVRVRALARPSADTGILRQMGIEAVEGDITDADAVNRAVEGCGVVYNFASPFRDAGATHADFAAVNRDALGHLIDAARRHRIARLVHCSTIGVHGDVKQIPCTETSPYNPGDSYQQTKLEGEQLLRTAMDADEIPAVIMRPSSMYGPGDLRMLKLFRTIRKRRFRMVGSGDVWLHPAYIDDLVDGFVRCGERPEALGGVFILAGAEPVKLNDLVRLVADAVEVPPPRGRVPLWPVMAAAKACERICRPLGIDPPLYERRVRFFTNDRYFDDTHARRTLGYAPAMPLAVGLKRTAQWYLRQGLLDGAAPDDTHEPAATQKQSVTHGQ